jgi:uncharacterized protein YlzI (FlbEa/FlbD family)
MTIELTLYDSSGKVSVVIDKIESVTDEKRDRPSSKIGRLSGNPVIVKESREEVLAMIAMVDAKEQIINLKRDLDATIRETNARFESINSAQVDEPKVKENDLADRYRKLLAVYEDLVEKHSELSTKYDRRTDEVINLKRSHVACTSNYDLCQRKPGYGELYRENTELGYSNNRLLNKYNALRKELAEAYASQGGTLDKWQESIIKNNSLVAENKELRVECCALRIKVALTSANDLTSSYSHQIKEKYDHKHGNALKMIAAGVHFDSVKMTREHMIKIATDAIEE